MEDSLFLTTGGAEKRYSPRLILPLDFAASVGSREVDHGVKSTIKSKKAVFRRDTELGLKETTRTDQTERSDFIRKAASPDV